MTSWAQTAAPSVEPVSLAEQKRWLRLLNADTDDEQRIEDCIKAAREYTENVTGVAMITQTWALKLDYFCSRNLILPKYPVSSISSLTYYDSNNASQTFSADNYALGAAIDGLNFVQLVDGASWPSVYNRTGAITVTFVCGYGTIAQAVPSDLRSAVKILAAHWFENPMFVSSESFDAVPMSYHSLVAGYMRALPYAA